MSSGKHARHINHRNGTAQAWSLQEGAVGTETLCSVGTNPWDVLEIRLHFPCQVVENEL